MRVNEEMAVLTALQKIVKARLDEARAAADEALLAEYAEDGTTKKALKLGGIKVGDYIVVLNKGQWAVSDRAAFEDFALAYGFAEARQSIRPEYMAAVVGLVAREMPEAILEEVRLDPKWESYVANVAGVATYLDSGMAVPGLEYTGQTVKGTQVRGCRPEDVAPILQSLGDVERMLLGEAPEIIELTDPEED